MTSRRDAAEPAYRIRPATLEDTGFLADVVLTATRAQGRVPGDFDEPAWRDAFTEWTRKQIRGEVPDSATSVIESGGGRAGRLRITHCWPSDLPGDRTLVPKTGPANWKHPA